MLRRWTTFGQNDNHTEKAFAANKTFPFKLIPAGGWHSCGLSNIHGNSKEEWGHMHNSESMCRLYSL